MTLKAISIYTKEIFEAFKAGQGNLTCYGRVILWSLPLTGEIKLNTDGCYYESNNKSGFGGVFRDSSGSWILGFYGKGDCSGCLEAEIWAIYRGLTIILKKGMINVKVESDSSIVVQYLQRGPPSDHPQSHIMEEARRIATGTNTTFSHIYRQANQTADCLARLGSQQEDDLIVTRNVPLAAREFVMSDALGVGHLRV